MRGYYGEKITKKVTITSPEEQPLRITDITSTIEDKIKYKLNTVEKGKEYSLEIKTHSGIKESFRGKVALKTNSQKKPELELIVMGTLQKEIKVAPQHLYFGTIDTQKGISDTKSLTKTAIVSSVRESGLIIEKIESSSEWIMAEIETNQRGEKYTIIIKLDKNKLPKGKFKEKIKIHTKYKKSSEIADIILEGKVI